MYLFKFKYLEVEGIGELRLSQSNSTGCLTSNEALPAEARCMMPRSLRVVIKPCLAMTSFLILALGRRNLSLGGFL